MNVHPSTLPKYHPDRERYDEWVNQIGQKRYDDQNKWNGFKHVKSMKDLYDDYMNSNEFQIAFERYERAYQLMKKKERLKKELPPKGSAFYRYFIDSDKNPPSHAELCRQIDSLTE